MEQTDVRTLNAAWREQLRRMVVRLHKRGRTMTRVDKELGLYRQVVSAWVAAEEVRLGRTVGS